MQLRDGSLLFSASDLTAFTACPRLTWLQREVALNGRPRPANGNDGGALSARKGLEHEQRYLESVRAAGLCIVEIPTRHGAEGTRQSAAETLEAMRSGADIVFQAVFFDGDWLGHVDFLRKLEDVRSDLGRWSYEAVDTKLARHVKPYFVVQLALYSELLARAQGREPEHIEIVLGTGESERLRLRDFDAYVRRLRGRFVDHVATTSEPYPDPVEHCAICDWADECDAIRLADDHLSQVAGMRRDQVVKLMAHGVPTMADLAAAVERPAGVRIGDETYLRLRAQAALQTQEKADATPRYELLAPREERGFALLPEPSPHDVFFDMEGDPYYDSDGLEYLFGVDYAEGSEWTFRAFWGRDRREERQAFEEFIDWVIARWRAHPDLHVYHYAHYEPTALKRLAGQHGTREEEVDELLRHGVLVDLYAVVRHGIRISRPSYSIKEMEAFYRGEKRQTAVGEGGESIEVFEEWLETGEQALLDSIEEYNADDCRSTRELRDWLLDRRKEAWEQQGVAYRYVAPDPHVVDEEQQKIDAETRDLMDALLDGVPRDAEDRDDNQQGRWLLAQLLDYHRREQRVVWWRFFALCLMDHE
jgi:predicted RecB family nuclease